MIGTRSRQHGSGEKQVRQDVCLAFISFNIYLDNQLGECPCAQGIFTSGRVTIFLSDLGKRRFCCAYGFAYQLATISSVADERDQSNKLLT